MYHEDGRPVAYYSKKLQPDWPSETETLKKNLPWNWEDYAAFEYTDEKLSAKRIQLCCDPSLIFLFFGVFLKNNFTANDNGAWVTAQLDAPRQKL